MLLIPLSSRKQLTRWASWFFIINAIFVLMIGVSYVFVMPSFSQIPLLNVMGESIAIIFVILALIGQTVMLMVVTGGLAILLILICPKRWFTVAISIALGSLMVLLLICDAIIYHLYHYHLLGLVWHIAVSGAFSQIIILSPLEWLIVAFSVLGIVCLECLLAYWLWQRQQSSNQKRYGQLIGLVVVCCLLVSYSIYLAAAYIKLHPKRTSVEQQTDAQLVIREARVIPYYTKIFPSIALKTRKKDIMDSGDEQQLAYPLQPLHFNTIKKPMNIVVIVIDTWRYDMMNSKLTPHISALAQRSFNFSDHYSGGNSTQPGIFSLFYSLPSTYWSAMLNQHRGPVFIQQLLKENYQLKVLASAELNFPAFDKTVFRDVPDLQIYMPGNDPVIRDANMTNEFDTFIANRDTQRPFFGFLFYDTVHAFCSADAKYPQPFQPAIAQCNRVLLTNNTDPIPYINRYKNAVHYVDGLVGKVLQTLKSQHLLKNTIIVVTADHGEEFNDEHLGYWGHASAFDPYQLRTPLIVYWPGMKPETIYYQTSHYDVVPTLMKKALGVTTPISAYSVGRSLFSSHRPPYLIVGSYVDYAILQPSQTTIIYSTNDYGITYPDGHIKPGAKLNPALIRSVYKKLNRYYQ